MRIEIDLQDDEARKISGLRGVKSKSFTKKFSNAAAMNRWLEENGDDCEIIQIERAV
ncbi:MAG TPA: hypothetical protein VNN79_06140 [Actinomycetota bacterium]|nr:hypothetical protein [Actinomycetota bacterium]